MIVRLTSGTSLGGRKKELSPVKGLLREGGQQERKK